MENAQTLVDAPGDAELISAVRAGDLSAYGDLFERHVEAARRLARQLVNAADADDLVSDAFAKVMRVLQHGGGPDVAFRAYLLTAVRRLHVDKVRAASRLHTTDDMEKFDPGVPFRDTAVEGFENEAAAKAFASLPERWQLVLWHTEVEGQKPAEVAPLLGMSANSVSALAYRAREGLRQAFLNSHVDSQEDAECEWTHEHLGAYVRDGASKRDAARVEGHIDECRPCMGLYLELAEVNSNLGALLAPLLLGGAATGYLATAGGVAKGGLLLVGLERARDYVAGNTQAAAFVGVAAATAVVAASILVVTDDGSVVAGSSGLPAAAPETSAAAPAPAAPPAQDDPPARPERSRPSRTAPAPPPPVDVTPDDPPAVVSEPTGTVGESSGTDAPRDDTRDDTGDDTGDDTRKGGTDTRDGGSPPPDDSTPPPDDSTPPPDDTTPPAPTARLALTVSATRRGATITFDTRTRGYLPGGEARLVITADGVNLHGGRVPDDCTQTSTALPVRIVCDVGATSPDVLDLRFVNLDALARVTFQLTATNLRHRYADATDRHVWS